jgi:DNA-binding NarL/FixJ family response regulator
VSLTRQLFPRRFGHTNGRTSGRVTVLLAEDSQGHIDLYGGFLHNSPDVVELLGVVQDPTEIEDAIARAQPQVLLLDHLFKESAHPDITGTSLVPRLRSAFPKLAIALLTSEKSPQLVHQFFEAAKGTGRAYIIKGEDDKQDLLDYIQAIAKGYDYVSNSLKSEYDDYVKFETLEPEDLAILELLSRGLTYDAVGRRIAERIGYPLSERAITDHVRRMADKLNILRETEEGDPVDRRFLLQTRFLASRGSAK